VEELAKDRRMPDAAPAHRRDLAGAAGTASAGAVGRTRAAVRIAQAVDCIHAKEAHCSPGSEAGTGCPEPWDRENDLQRIARGEEGLHTEERERADRRMARAVEGDILLAGDIAGLRRRRGRHDRSHSSLG